MTLYIPTMLVIVALLLINRDFLINNFRKGILIYSLVISIVLAGYVAKQ